MPDLTFYVVVTVVGRQARLKSNATKKGDKSNKGKWNINWTYALFPNAQSLAGPPNREPVTGLVPSEPDDIDRALLRWDQSTP
jgi:hypothetical protein